MLLCTSQVVGPSVTHIVLSEKPQIEIFSRSKTNTHLLWGLIWLGLPSYQNRASDLNNSQRKKKASSTQLIIWFLLFLKLVPFHVPSIEIYPYIYAISFFSFPPFSCSLAHPTAATHSHTRFYTKWKQVCVFVYLLLCSGCCWRFLWITLCFLFSPIFARINFFHKFSPASREPEEFTRK